MAVVKVTYSGRVYRHYINSMKLRSDLLTDSFEVTMPDRVAKKFVEFFSQFSENGLVDDKWKKEYMIYNRVLKIACAMVELYYAGSYTDNEYNSAGCKIEKAEIVEKKPTAKTISE